MSKTLEDLKNIVTSSNLPGTDQNDLLIFLPVLPEKILEDLLDIFKKSPKMLVAFNDDFKSKLEALIDGRDAYQKMVEKETNLIDTWQSEFGNPEEMKEDEIPEQNENLPQKENDEEEYLDDNN